MKVLNHFKKLSVLLAAMAAMSPALPAAELAFSGSNLNATNRAVVILSAKGNKGDETPSIRWLTATSDLATAVIGFYRSGNPVKISQASSAGTNRVYVGTSGATFATSNQVVVVRHVSADTYERLVTITNTSQTVTFTTATASAVAVGDEITIHTLDAVIPIGATVGTNFNHPEGIYHGIPGRPLLFEVNGTTLCKISLYSGRFWRPD